MVYQKFLLATKFSVVVLIASLLLACGGGSSEESGAGDEAAQTAQFDSGINLSGRAVKGVIKSGIVNAYVVDEESGRFLPSQSAAVAPVRTDSNGYYSLVIPSKFGGSQLLIEITADEVTRMTCEVVGGCGDASGVEFGDSFAVDAEFVLSSVSKPLASSSDNVAHVTPYTHMVRVKAEAASDGMSLASVSQSVSEVESMLGFADQIVYAEPIDLTSDKELQGATFDQVEVALVSAAIQKAESGLEFDGVSDVLDAITQQLTQHESLVLVDNGLEPTVALDDLMYEAQQELSSLSTVGAVIASEDAERLEAEFSSAQQQALDEGSLVTPVQIMGQPSSVSLVTGASFELSVGAIGGGAMAFQWFKNGQAMLSEVSSNLAVAAASVANSGQYSVRVSNEVGSVMSVVVSVSVADPAVPEIQPAPAILHDVSLSWDIPLEREDGSSLSLFEIDGYTIVYGMSADQLNSTVRVVGGQQTSHTLNDLEEGTYFFSIATIDSDGVQGRYSDVVQIAVN